MNRGSHVIISGSRKLTRVEDLLPADLAAQLDRLDVTSRKVFAGKLQGERRSKQRGSSVEFADHRNYVAGDDLRRIDWNVFARLDKFFIKIFQEEQDLTVSVILDASASMDAGTAPPAPAGANTLPNAGNKLAFAQRLATAVAYVGLVHNNRVVVSVLDGTTLRRLAPLRGRRSVQRIARFILDAARADDPNTAGGILSDEEFYEQETGKRSGASPTAPAIPAAVRGDWTSALRALAATRGGRGVCVLVSDFLIPGVGGAGGYQAGLNYLAGRGFDTFCVQVLSPAELDPALEGRDAGRGGAGGVGGPLVGDLELTDAETGRGAEVTMTAELIDRYKAAVKRYIADLGAFCAARAMTHVPLVSDMDLRNVLVEQLRRQRLLG